MQGKKKKAHQKLQNTKSKNKTITDQPIKSLEEFVVRIRKEFVKWYAQGCEAKPWFWGQPVDKPPIPRVFRDSWAQRNETILTNRFRIHGVGLGKAPDRDHKDEWLFLMQHSGLPTRLLDWTEGAMIALFFALWGLENEKEAVPVVWMLAPLELNKEAFGQRGFRPSWEKGAIENFKRAFTGKGGHELPVAVHPTGVHSRIHVQKSVFTIHGKKTDDMVKLYRNTDLIRNGYLKKFVIDPPNRNNMLYDLGLMGISYSNLFPDFDGLAKDMTRMYTDL